MKRFGSIRVLLLVFFLCLIPTSSFAGVFISVNFAPPLLPVYDQPPCPEDGWMWIPGYWAYGDDGYYWVPGTWVPAPYEGALWTPGYWGWGSNLYIWHPGYWGDHVGYYGGVNYGFGYMGIGFLGGMWSNHHFRYNTAYERVNERFIHNTYVDRRDADRYTIRNDRHVAFSGGPGGIDHRPAPEEQLANRDRHVGETSFQSQHENSAMQDRGSFARNNGGRPSTVAVERPLTGRGGPDNRVGAPMNSGRQAPGQNPAANVRSNNPGVGPANGNSGGRPNFDNNNRNPQAPQTGGNGTRGGGNQPQQQGPQQPQNFARPAPESRPVQPQQQRPQNYQRPVAPQQQSQPRPAPTPSPMPQARPAPESRPAQPQRQEQRSAPSQGRQDNRERGR